MEDTPKVGASWVSEIQHTPPKIETANALKPPAQHQSTEQFSDAPVKSNNVPSSSSSTAASEALVNDASLPQASSVPASKPKRYSTQRQQQKTAGIHMCVHVRVFEICSQHAELPCWFSG